MTPKKLEDKVVQMILPRLSDEFYASYHYRAGESWALGEGFEIAAKFFAKESAEELAHAKKLEKYLVDWNVIPNLPQIEPPKLTFSSLPDAIGFFYKMEYDLYEAYEATAKDIFTADLCTFALMQEMLAIQNKSVAEYSDMLNMLKGVSGDKFELLKLQKLLFK